MKKQALGRGLSALLQDSSESIPAAAGLTEIPLEALRENPLQPRRQFDQEKLEELAASIREYGVVQPVVVTREGDGYRLVVGERRCRAARLAGLASVPALIREMAGPRLLEVALIENIQRDDLNPIEEAQAYSFLLREHEWTQEELAGRLGKSRPAVTNALRLLALPEPIKVDLESGVLSSGHARTVLSLESEHKQLEAWSTMRRLSCSVRQAEALVANLNRPARKGPQRAELAPDWVEIQAHLEHKLGSVVRIRPRTKGRGHIELAYSNSHELERLVELLIYLGERLEPPARTSVM